MLEPIDCPNCKRRLYSDNREQKSATSFESCRRKCVDCGIGFSNAKTDPKIIYKTPEQNVYPSVRLGLLEVLGRAVNILNRPNKINKFTSISSEDALTWSVFRFLEDKDHLKTFVELLGVTCSSMPQLYLWGVSTKPPYHVFEHNSLKLNDAALRLKENPNAITEPDVIIYCPDSTIIFIEVKLYSKNDISKTDDKMRKYIEYDLPLFLNSQKALDSLHYELIRNWVLGNIVSGDTQFMLVNLAPASLFEDNNGEHLKCFIQSLDIVKDKRSFKSISWEHLFEQPNLLSNGFLEYIKTRLCIK